MKYQLIIIALALSLVACTKKAETSEVIGVGEFEVQRLFTHEGCTIYRFQDSGYNRYYSKCSMSSEAFSSTSHPCGKGCTSTQHHSNVTSYKE